MSNIVVIGKKSCGKCQDLKEELNEQEVDFEYKDLNSIPVDERREYVQKARDNDMTYLPLVFKDNQIIDKGRLV